jgi:glycosyltransferase involved in cell wall biosynthesis
MIELKTPIRILHVVGLLDRGGTETGLMHILRHIDRDWFKLDFLTHATRPAAYDEEARQLGAQIIPCLAPRQPFQYARNFQRIMREYGPYDIVHSHSSHFSGFVQRLAYTAGIPVRISHSRNCFDEDAHRLPRPIRDVYLAFMKHWLDKYTTVGLAVSEAAAQYLFGEAWDSDPRNQVLHSGNDFSGFETTFNRDVTRRELGIPEDAFVIGHVGSFNWVKNHDFLVDVATEVRKQEPAIWLLLVGKGEFRSRIESRVADMGLADQTVFSGVRDDIPRIMQAMDILVFPSHREGLPRVIIEAQAAGLPCVISSRVTEEVVVNDLLVKRVSLDKSAAQWAEIILTTHNQPMKVNRAQALALMKNSHFNIENQIRILEQIYSEQLLATRQTTHTITKHA